MRMIDADELKTRFAPKQAYFTEAINEKIDRVPAILAGDLLNRWHPVNEKLPETDDYILLSFENAPVPDVGRYDRFPDGSGAFYLGDDEKSCVSFGLFVNAWMPLPECYQEEDE